MKKIIKFVVIFGIFVVILIGISGFVVINNTMTISKSVSFNKEKLLTQREQVQLLDDQGVDLQATQTL